MLTQRQGRGQKRKAARTAKKDASTTAIYPASSLSPSRAAAARTGKVPLQEEAFESWHYETFFLHHMFAIVYALVVWTVGTRYLDIPFCYTPSQPYQARGACRELGVSSVMHMY